VVPVMGGFESHKLVPLSLTFDHRACTGGEAARFLAALLGDLAQPN
jgi:pyruvate dehydrogenase E2 component (dihydrolipoamide acetyltransferase)